MLNSPASIPSICALNDQLCMQVLDLNVCFRTICGKRDVRRNCPIYRAVIHIPNIESVAEVKPKPIKQLTKKEANKTLALVIFELANYAYPKFSELNSDEFSKAIKAEVDHLADFSWAHCWTDWD